MFYHDDYHALDELSDASHRRVLDAVVLYSETGEIVEGLDLAERIAFRGLKKAVDRDNERYQSRVDAGRKGGRAKASNAKQDLATSSKASNAKQDLATSSKATNSNSNTNSNTNSNPNTNDSLSQGEGNGEREIPSVEEVRKYAELAGLEVDAEAFVTVNAARGWTDSNGRPIRDWKLWLEYSPLTKRKGDTHEGAAEPDRTGQRDEYGAIYL
jgi:hypothetical protein